MPGPESTGRPKNSLRGEPVSRILSAAGCPAGDGHSSGPRLATWLKLPTRTPGLKRPCSDIPERINPARGPYSALLPVGLAMRVLLPVPRWALTPPFHPHLYRIQAVCSLWRFPSGCPARALPGTVASGSPDFPRKDQGPSAAIQPSAPLRIRRPRGCGQCPGGGSRRARACIARRRRLSSLAKYSRRRPSNRRADPVSPLRVRPQPAPRRRPDGRCRDTACAHRARRRISAARRAASSRRAAPQGSRPGPRCSADGPQPPARSIRHAE